MKKSEKKHDYIDTWSPRGVFHQRVIDFVHVQSKGNLYTEIHKRYTFMRNLLHLFVLDAYSRNS